ncbi:MAG TPA: glycerophosphodiester phosphodiesterase family protein [Clostridiales bacterium]|jgi:glycerophosphoryl diester phosphodiesterase|nr:glycerophosphodiester phosphodiesterase family protein [Clostridiales bacterium]
MSCFDEIRQAGDKRILLAAHRGISGGNIPCNTLAAFEIALRQGADIIELDVQRSADGQLYVFHEGKEGPHLLTAKHFIRDNTSEAIRDLRYVNQDNEITQFGVNTLDEALEFLRDKCYINLDHCWHFFPEAVACVRRQGIEEQIILKSGPKQKFFDIIAECAPDILYMPIVNTKDDCFDILCSMDINFAGVEVVFSSADSELASKAYIDKLHRAGKLIWANAIIYRHTVQLSAGMSDDTSLTGDPADGWGRLADMGYDIIQTDWVGMCREYLTQTGKIYKKHV